MNVTTDASGFFVAVLDSGSYTAGSGAFSSRITVEQGTAVLVPLRAGAACLVGRVRRKRIVADVHPDPAV